MFWVGRVYQMFLDLYDSSKAEIVALSDNDAGKWGLPNFIEPYKITEMTYDYIIFTTVYYAEIKRQLCGYGIEPERILNFYDVYANLAPEDNYRIFDLLKDNVPISVQYEEEIRRLKSMQENGYYYMGSNSAGNNAFFVRKDCIDSDRIPEDADIFVESKYRESRDEKGKLTYLKGINRLKCIRTMEVFEIENGCTDTIANIYHI